MAGYPGSKSQAGTVKRIVSLIPAHRVYLEPFMGSGVVLGTKKPSDWEIGVDIDRDVVAAWRHRRWWRGGPIVVPGDALRVLSSWKTVMDPTWFVYVDAPYPLSVRAGRRMYAHEPAGAADDGALKRDSAWHKELLNTLLSLPCRVMVSCYWNPLYVGVLQEWQRWRAESFKSSTRGGVSQEWLWMNYGPEVPLHDVRYVGRGFRERERIKRVRKRWLARFVKMPSAERQVIMEALAEAEASFAAGERPAASLKPVRASTPGLTSCR